MLRKILCISGGGVKGVSQVDLFKRLEKENNKSIYQTYDLITGSSVGAINGALIATGKITLDDLSDIYPEMLKKVFKKKFGLGFPKYDRKNFSEIWNNIIGSNFKMGDVKTKLMITSVDRVKDENCFFKSWHDDDADERLVDVVMRSFAAPIYFGQMIDKQRKKVWFDGGTGYANLPLMETKTQIESFGWYDKEDEIQDETTNQVLIDAVGCLFYDEHLSFEEACKGRWLKQGLDFINPKNGGMARAQSKNDQIRMMNYLASKNTNIKFRYWDYEIPEEMDKLDGIKYVNDYKKFGIEMAKKPIIDLI
jgi:hypothetical protein